ncbi:FkbM family methyltransferase [Nitrosomonas marina]|uniref:Methyltransferase, FkbM family n=1 Tax=Nitrosomonas marina TaxID=917 RepID=A0A1H8ABC6_9PROT|nr:FkbM family methyltransferase [Nitrosomonas marina]SEM67853.1 methyltransferase, FkbM family [Nitrosomonas marina]
MLVNFFKNIVIAFYQLIGGFTRTTVRGQPIRIAVDHWRVLKRARNYSIKEPDTLDWLDQFKPDTCYFDIGANIGQYSLYPAKKYGQSVQIFAFEPQSNNYYSLNKNVYINGLADQIAAYCVAVSGKTEFSKLYIPKFIPGGNRSQFGREDVRNMKIPATHIQGMFGVTLDDLCGLWGFPYPNYMKIDVDGIEISILRGAEKVLRNPQLVSVIIELGTANEQEEAVQLMSAAGFQVKHKTTQNWGETCFIFERP